MVIISSTIAWCLPRSPHITSQITSIAGMCVGWAAGDVVVKLMHDHLATTFPSDTVSTDAEAPPVDQIKSP